jgi:hypothetical protein
MRILAVTASTNWSEVRQLRRLLATSLFLSITASCNGVSTTFPDTSLHLKVLTVSCYLIVAGSISAFHAETFFHLTEQALNS